MTHHTTISKFRSLIIKTCLVCILTIPSCHGDYDCLCSYEVEKAIYPVPDKQATPIGYVYEFDCKEHLTSLDTGNFAAIAFEKQLGYIEEGSNQNLATCQGEPSIDDKIPVTIKGQTTATTTAVLTSTTTRTTLPSTRGPTSGIGTSAGVVSSGVGTSTEGVTSGVGTNTGGGTSGTPTNTRGVTSGIGIITGGVTSGTGTNTGVVTSGIGTIIAGVSSGTGITTGVVTSGTGTNTGEITSGVGTKTGVTSGTGTITGGVTSGLGTKTGVTSGIGTFPGGFTSGTEKITGGVTSGPGFITSVKPTTNGPIANMTPSTTLSQLLTSSTMAVLSTSVSPTSVTGMPITDTSMTSKSPGSSTTSPFTEVAAASTTYSTGSSQAYVTNRQTSVNTVQSNAPGSLITTQTNEASLAPNSTFKATALSSILATSPPSTSSTSASTGQITSTLTDASTASTQGNSSRTTRVSAYSPSAHTSAQVTSTSYINFSPAVTNQPNGRVDLCPYKLLSESPYVNGQYPYWGQLGHYCYELRPDVVVYSKAQQDCSNRHGNVLMVPSYEVERLILDLLANTKYQHPIWLGLTKAGQTWTWSNGTVLAASAYNRWNSGYEDTFARNCAVMDGTYGDWKPSFCETFLTETGSYPYICQYRIEY